MAQELIEEPAAGEDPVKWAESLVGADVLAKAARCADMKDFRRAYPTTYHRVVREGRVALMARLYADGTIDSIRPDEVTRRRDRIGKLRLRRAAACRDFAHFRRMHPADYAALLASGNSGVLYDMYEDGTIDAIREELKPKRAIDLRFKENRRTPNIKRAQVLKQAKAYPTYLKFMRSGGEFPKAAKRLGMEEQLKRYFSRLLHPDEVFEEAELFKSWDEFKFHRPRYAAYAEETNMKEAVVRYIAQAVQAKGGKKK